MTHMRIDDGAEVSERQFECGIGPELPPGDTWVFYGAHQHLVDCPGCLHGQPPYKLGTPLSKLSGRPGHRGFEEFSRVAESWGY